MIDNYDSFTYNLVQLFGTLGVEMEVHRNDALDVSDIEAMKPEAVVISPGPCTPDEAGISVEVVSHFLGRIPILGVCLGHQSIAQALGGRIIRAPKLVHGKTSLIHHDGRGLFRDVENPFAATRYHSLIAETSSLPAELEVSARTDEEEIMAFRHRDTLCLGVQFHPESVLTLAGPSLARNFIGLVSEASC
jgi:anthranilate synthase/aminodeoxychorismate synthase-like glutamine amidotransferase